MPRKPAEYGAADTVITVRVPKYLRVKAKNIAAELNLTLARYITRLIANARYPAGMERTEDD